MQPVYQDFNNKLFQACFQKNLLTKEEQSFWEDNTYIVVRHLREDTTISVILEAEPGKITWKWSKIDE